MVIHAETAFHNGDCVKLIGREDLGKFEISSICVYATTNGGGRLKFTLRQKLFEEPSGYAEYFTMRGIEESQLVLTEQDCHCEDGPNLEIEL